MAISDPYIDIVGSVSPLFLDSQGSFVEEIPISGVVSNMIILRASFVPTIEIAGLSDTVEAV